MTPPLSRRDAIAAAITGSHAAAVEYYGGEVVPKGVARNAVAIADALIAELDRTAPKDLGTVWLRQGGGPTRVYDHQEDAGPGAILVRLVPVEE